MQANWQTRKAKAEISVEEKQEHEVDGQGHAADLDARGNEGHKAD
jgi:hypothetical protein